MAPSGKYSGEGYLKGALYGGTKFKANWYVDFKGDKVSVWMVPPDAWQGFMRFQMHGSYDEGSGIANVSGAGENYTMHFSGNACDWGVHMEFEGKSGKGNCMGKFTGDCKTRP